MAETLALRLPLGDMARLREREAALTALPATVAFSAAMSRHQLYGCAPIGPAKGPKSLPRLQRPKPSDASPAPGSQSAPNFGIPSERSLIDFRLVCEG